MKGLVSAAAFALGLCGRFVAADNYQVDFNGQPNYVHVHGCQGVDARCGQETNNLASFTMDGKTPVQAVVTSLNWSPDLGDEVSIRPSYLLEEGIVSELSVVNSTSNSKSISFLVNKPCQFSVEIGDEDALFPDDNSLYDYANLILSFNPPVSEWPRKPPSMDASGQACQSSEKGRTCALGAADDSCDQPITVASNQDLWFRGNGDPAGFPKEYLFGDGCGDSPKKIFVETGGRVFLDEDVILYARVLAAGFTPLEKIAQVPKRHLLRHAFPERLPKQQSQTDMRAPNATTFVAEGQCDPEGFRDDCGLPIGKSQQSCEAGGCCWAPVNPNPQNLPWCFHQAAPSPAPSAPSPSTPSPSSPSPSSPAPSSGDSVSGLYGYGIISNVHMQGHKLPQGVVNVVALTDDKSEVWGVTVLDSTYRNIRLGSGGRLDWTKSFAWNSETDCINMAGPGGRVSNNFFKSNDDCLKAYQNDSVYVNNVVWHQAVGRVLMFSWGNLNEAEDTDGSVQFINTSIIHDKLAFRQANQLHSNPDNDALGWQAGMIYYSALINAQHSPTNHIGTPDSPVYIENLRVESRVGGLLLITNGYAGLDNKAGWMAKNGCTGNINLHINGLDLLRVRSYAAPNVGGGCNLDSSYGGIANANCICTSNLGCNAQQCAVNIKIENVRESQESGNPSFKDSLIQGDNAVLSYSAAVEQWRPGYNGTR